MIPWGSIMYLVGDAMYGGRVSDDWDRRVLVTYAEEYMGDFIFDDHNRFYFSKIGYDYKVPRKSSAEDYKGEIENMPLLCGPPVFGLHPNAEITYFLNSSRALWTNTLAMMPRSGGGGGGIPAKSRHPFHHAKPADVNQQLAD